MPQFHIGCNIDEIELIAKNTGESAETHPTTIYFKSGRTVNATGEWRDNCKAIVDLATGKSTESLEQLALLGEMNKRLLALNAAVSHREKTLADLDRVITAGERNLTPDQRLFAVAVRGLKAKRNHLLKEEREAIMTLLGIE